MNEERRLPLHEDDIVKIANLINTHTDNCRFHGIDPDELNETVKFVRNFNKVMEESRSIVRKTVLSAVVLFILGLIGLGAGHTLSDMVKKYWAGQ